MSPCSEIHCIALSLNSYFHLLIHAASLHIIISTVQLSVDLNYTHVA